MIDLRLGRWQDVLSDVDEVDSVIVDAPYSEKTHKGHDATERAGFGSDGAHRTALGYHAWTFRDVLAFVSGVNSLVRPRGWWVTITDHVLAPAWADAMERLAGLYVFAPLPIVIPGSRVRLSGDGPSSWSYWCVVGRPRRDPFSRWGTLDGAYVAPRGLPASETKHAIQGGKPLWLMRALVRDYTRPGDVVLDPCAGGATTLIAASIEGRSAIGCEVDPETFRLASQRIGAGVTPVLPGLEDR